MDISQVTVVGCIFWLMPPPATHGDYLPLTHLALIHPSKMAFLLEGASHLLQPNLVVSGKAITVTQGPNVLATVNRNGSEPLIHTGPLRGTLLTGTGEEVSCPLEVKME